MELARGRARVGDEVSGRLHMRLKGGARWSWLEVGLEVGLE